MRILACLALSLVCFGAGAAEVPFRWTPGQIEVHVSFDGKAPVWCILDSGAEITILDEQVAKTLQAGRRATLTIGPVRLPGVELTLRPLDNFRRQKRDIRCVVGYQLFERYVVTIDFQKRVVIVSEPAAFRPRAGATAFPLAFAGRLPVVQAEITSGGRSLPVRLMVDTGASQAVVLRHPYVSEHQLMRPGDATTTSETVAAGPTPFVTLSIQELRLGRWKFRNPAVKAYGSARGAGGYRSSDGLLGNDILRHFRVTFDYSRRRLLLEEVRPSGQTHSGDVPAQPRRSR